MQPAWNQIKLSPIVLATSILPTRDSWCLCQPENLLFIFLSVLASPVSQYVTRKHKRKKKKGSRTTYTVIASDATSRKLRIDELVGEMSASPSVTKMEKQRIVQTSTDSQEPRWIAKAKAKRLARAPCKNEPRSTKIHETVAAKNTHSELQAGSSAHLQNRTAAMRTRRPRAPQRGDVRDTND